MRATRRPSTGRRPSTPAAPSRPPPPTSDKTTDHIPTLPSTSSINQQHDSHGYLPPSSYVPYADRHNISVPRIQPCTTPYRPLSERSLADQPLASPPDRHPDSISSGYDSQDDGSDNFPHDRYHHRPHQPAHGVVSTLPEPSPAAKTGKLRKGLSSHTYAQERNLSDRNPQIMEDARRRGWRDKVIRRSNATDSSRDFPSSTASSSSGLQGGTLDPSETEITTTRWVLQGNGPALPKHARTAWTNKNFRKKTVRVEANPCGLAPTCLYASDDVSRHMHKEPFKKTEFITSKPQWMDPKSIVYQDSQFEIGVVGMKVTSKDSSLLSNGNNELLMYSLHRDPEDEHEESDALPYIHYDPSLEDNHGGTEPDHFIPIPASRSLFMVSDGANNETGHKARKARKSVNVRFKILELDQVDDFMRMSLTGIEELGKYVSQFSKSAPLIGLLNPALSLASTVSRRALESHAKPDNVINTDMKFLLAERREPDVQPDGTVIPFEHRSGEYLRYGYYFFLEKPVNETLYASFRTFPNVELMLQRTEEKLSGGEKRFFPLSGVSYLVIRVTPRISSVQATRRPIRMSQIQRLEDLMKTSLVTDEEADAKHVVKTLADLAKDLGLAGHGGGGNSRNDVGNQGTGGIGSEGSGGGAGQWEPRVENEGSSWMEGQRSSEMGNGQLPGKWNDRLTETGNGMLSETPNGEFPETLNGQFGETRNGQFGETGNEQFGETGTGEWAETGNDEFGETRNGEFGETGNEQFGETGTGEWAETRDDEFGETGNGAWTETGNDELGESGGDGLDGVGREAFSGDRAADLGEVGGRDNGQNGEEVVEDGRGDGEFGLDGPIKHIYA